MENQQNYTQWVFVGMVCNAKCWFCNTQIPIVWEKNYFKFYGLDRIKKDIELKIWEWATCIIYEWWDFSMHTEIFKILEFWQKLWIKQTFQTNWIKLADFQFVKKIKKYWIKEINFSIHAFEEKISDNIMWVKWIFQKTLKWVLNCNKLWINISNNFVLIKDNVNQLEWIIFLLLKLNIKLLNIIMYIPINWEWKNSFHKQYMVNPKLAWEKMSEMLENYYQLQNISNNNLKLNFKFYNIWRCIINKKFHNLHFYYDLDRRKSKYDFETGFYKKKSCKKCVYNYNCPWFTEKYISFFWEDYIKPIIF